MKAQPPRDAFGGFDPSAYEAEVSERWGDTDAYRESSRRTSAYSREDWERITAEADEIESAFADCLTSGEQPEGPRARELAERHRLHIDAAYYPCSHEMHCILADMYVGDERFARHYDDRAPGLAAYVRAAIVANAIARA